MLGLYGFAGWFIGMQNSRFPMYIAITQNIVNIAASLCFVYLLHMKVAGVAWGTLTAQYAGFLMALLLWRRYYGGLKKHIAWQEVLKREAMLRFFQVNRDIFLRTLCLVIVTLFFTSAGAAPRRNSISRQYFANAVIHSVFLYHGRVRLFRRSVGG